MTDESETTGAGGKLNRGQGLVAAFRAARIAQRPALKSDLRNSRAALRQERLNRLGRPEPLATAGTPTQDQASDEDIAAAAKPEPAPAPAGISVFATFLDNVAVEPEAIPAQAAQAPAEAAPPPDVAPDVAAPETAPEAPAAPIPRIPLSSIGFGPGMMIRMSHLGIETVQELAAADPVWLRGALGDISRLINVELWIASARNACSQAA